MEVQLQRALEDVQCAPALATACHHHRQNTEKRLVRGSRRVRNYERQQAQAFVDGFRLCCPSCREPKDCPDIIPRGKDGWTTSRCHNSECMYQGTINNWLCPCLILWPFCTVHSKWTEHACKLKTTADASCVRGGSNFTRDRTPKKRTARGKAAPRLKISV